MRKKPLKILVSFFVLYIFLGIFVFFYKTFWEGLPVLDSSKLQSIMKLQQPSFIKDYRGHTLYKVFEENRKYIKINNISPNMINAVIATEDNSFRENGGLDFWGIISAAKNYVGHKLGMQQNKKVRGASTISQQLIKNLILTNEKTLVRKGKERILTLRLYDGLEDYLKEKYGPQDKKTMKKKSKELLLELYLNMIFLGHGNYGVEIASQNYFRKPVKDLSVLESSILAGIIKAPSKFDLLKNQEKTIGSIVVKKKSTDGLLSIYTGDISSKTLSKYLYKKFDSINLKELSDNIYFLKILNGESFEVNHKGKKLILKYNPGRKDEVLLKMYEQGYINEKNLKKNISNGLNIKIHKNKKNLMKFPHFVFYIKDLLTKDKKFKHLGITEQSLKNGGYTIITTLDPVLQRTAMKTLYKYKKYANSDGANNRSFLYIDSKKGDVLAYVGSLDYNNKGIEGKVDMVQAPRQPGSIIKPFIYAYMIQNYGRNRRTRVLDSLLYVGRHRVDNFDFLHKGILSISRALAGSRNTPTVRIFLRVGEHSLKKYLKSLGLVGLNKKGGYGFGLVLGAGEVPMMQMANAYSHLSAFGKPAEINPILKITTKDGEVIYKRKVKKQKRILSRNTCNEIWKILSNTRNMPPGWANVLKVWGFTNATKSGTSNIGQHSRDGWLVLYTKSKVAITRAGRTDARPMNGYGGKINAPVLRKFFQKIISKGYNPN